MADYPWLAETPQLRTIFELRDVRDEHIATGITQVILVQAADNIDDTENMLRAARADPRVAGVVAWVPLRKPSVAAELLDRWSEEPIVGVRHLVHRDPDPELLRTAAVQDTLALLGAFGLCFDVCAESLPLLALVPELAQRHPATTFVIDHLAKPPIRERGWEPWASMFTEAAQYPNVVAKLSGLNTVAGAVPRPADYQPYVDHALAVFGPDRLMYGGDWPFALLAAGSYREIFDGLLGTLDALSAEDLDNVLTGTARRVYRLCSPAPQVDGPPVEDLVALNEPHGVVVGDGRIAVCRDHS